MEDGFDLNFAQAYVGLNLNLHLRGRSVINNIFVSPTSELCSRVPYELDDFTVKHED